MTTPNDLPSVGTEDVVQRVADLVQKHATAYAHDRFQQASNFEEKIDEKVRGLAAERDELASRVRELEGDAKRWSFLREQHEDEAESFCVFGPNGVLDCLEPVGSLPGELDQTIDAALNASKEHP